ncbi:MAG: dihydroorotate dehydrogenase [Nitrospirae bacterium CG18_big_fil_WC_8_21_14_2_50_70_55]|nr:dihydroorotate dehydrogenase-like protein [Deltaproteobacteria bacterium]OIP61818.1 MAG: dihydroorotate dehydrogenase [Nitrospirae bacterium CG2_30_70_394]PIQ04181.1 MAG: dihydroorotate dehydrogenase [Nitrospirae bacterium CG18_big_fil_WC_8_21_14_2_50_70_55]PIU79789.1 MAG: dihydroorotate dehydrogenase [Nitrospirae bacterium CG06_land_8_20_14_3_00_70_43]PIW82629.1 MAG: dihydroorotate dehydrogenase [Nitrospirae bacterium CG_4_8_14_3_um_filter_70_85]PIX83856.1 MAG: dihydroorotate dehydrogenase
MDLTTTYLGIPLPHPFIAGASPLSDDLDTVRRLEDAGAAAITLRSLFVEQLDAEGLATHRAMDSIAGASAEAATYLPDPDDFRLGPDAYLDHLRRVKAHVAIPVIASLNGCRAGGWLDYARKIAAAGADALEVNLYDVVTDPERSSAGVEEEQRKIVASVAQPLDIPVAVKLSPFYTGLPAFARHLQRAGAAGIVLFNRFFEPDLDIEALEVTPGHTPSHSGLLLLRLRWLAILRPTFTGSLAATGGVHTVDDAVKAIMAGADAIQLVTCLLRGGPARLTELRDGLARWLEAHDYDHLSQARGSMDLAHCPHPAAYRRAQYMRLLQTWSGE